MVHKIACSSWDSAQVWPSDNWKILSVHPAENGYLFQIWEGKSSNRRGIGSAFHQLCPKYSESLTPTAPMAICFSLKFHI